MNEQLNAPVVTRRSAQEIGTDAARFLAYLEGIREEIYSFPPLEIVPEDVMKCLGDEEEMPEEVIRARVIKFVSRLVAKHPGTWDTFKRHIVHVREVRSLLMGFMKLSPH